MKSPLVITLSGELLWCFFEVKIYDKSREMLTNALISPKIEPTKLMHSFQKYAHFTQKYTQTHEKTLPSVAFGSIFGPPEAEIFDDLRDVLMQKMRSWVHSVMCIPNKNTSKSPKLPACGGSKIEPTLQLAALQLFQIPGQPKGGHWQILFWNTCALTTLPLSEYR